MKSSSVPLLSATIICRNEERHIANCLSSLAFCDEILVIDSGSTDQTIKIAKEMATTVIQRPYIGANDQKEAARKMVHGEWILNLDADEVVPPTLVKEILATLESPKFSGYRIPIRTFIGDKHLQHNGYWPGYQKRLFKRELGYWNRNMEPHDHVCLNGRWGKLHTPIEHVTAQHIEGIEEKARLYGELAAKSLAKQGKRISILDRTFRPSWRFFRSYVLKAGFLDRTYGYRLARAAFIEGWIKYHSTSQNEQTPENH